MQFTRLLLLIAFIIVPVVLIAQSNAGYRTKTNKSNANVRFGRLPELKVGDEYFRIKAKDINGNLVDSKNWTGKIVVINYWFIACQPCKFEIPELNLLVNEFKNDSNIIFIAIGLDAKFEIKEFLESSPFDYTLIADGEGLKGTNTIRGYPTNLILDRTGKIQYYRSGYAPILVSRIRKSILELKNQQ